MLLNGPASHKKNNFINLTKYEEFPDFEKCELECCQNCEDPKSCNCLGSKFRYEPFDFDYNDLTEFEEGDIKILYRGEIRVFFDSVQSAQKEGYTSYDEKVYTKFLGFLYGYTGLRGDAKKLYLDIKKGDEKRIQLIHAPTPIEQKKYAEDADLVIWSCGYQTQKIKIHTQAGKSVKLSTQMMTDNKTVIQYDVDDFSRIYLANGTQIFSKIFGLGIGYPQRRSDGMIFSKKLSNDFNFTFYRYPKVDSFDLYRNYVGGVILKKL